MSDLSLSSILSGMGFLWWDVDVKTIFVHLVFSHVFSSAGWVFCWGTFLFMDREIASEQSQILVP